MPSSPGDAYLENEFLLEDTLSFGRKCLTVKREKTRSEQRGEEKQIRCQEIGDNRDNAEVQRSLQRVTS